MLFVAISLTGCGSCQRGWTGITGGLTYKCSKSGVEYVQSDSGLTLHVDISGKPIACK
jgi:hypothetical protein